MSLDVRLNPKYAEFLPIAKNYALQYNATINDPVFMAFYQAKSNFKMACLSAWKAGISNDIIIKILLPNHEATSEYAEKSIEQRTISKVEHWHKKSLKKEESETVPAYDQQVLESAHKALEKSYEEIAEYKTSYEGQEITHKSFRLAKKGDKQNPGLVKFLKANQELIRDPEALKAALINDGIGDEKTFSKINTIHKKIQNKKA